MTNDRFKSSFKPTSSNLSRGKVYLGSASQKVRSRREFKPQPGQRNILQTAQKDGKNVPIRPPKKGIYRLFNPIIDSYDRLLQDLHTRTRTIVQRTNYLARTTTQTIQKIYFRPQTQKIGIGIFVVTSLSAFLYFSIFSTVFLVKDYQISFTSGSYVDRNSLNQIIHKFSTNTGLGLFPTNHFWLLNDAGLTKAAMQVNPTVSNVKVVDRIWPNQAYLEFTTKPILATLRINDQYYLISQTGQVVGLDEGGLKQNVINVASYQKNLSVAELSNLFTQDRDLNVNNFQNSQLNRLYFVTKIGQGLEKRQLAIVESKIYTLYDKDTDVFFTLKNGTKLVFDSQNISIESNLNRLDVLRQTTKLGQELQDSKIAYLDLRARGLIYICYRGSECDQAFT